MTRESGIEGNYSTETLNHNLHFISSSTQNQSLLFIYNIYVLSGTWREFSPKLNQLSSWISWLSATTMWRIHQKNLLKWVMRRRRPCWPHQNLKIGLKTRRIKMWPRLLLVLAHPDPRTSVKNTKRKVLILYLSFTNTFLFVYSTQKGKWDFDDENVIKTPFTFYQGEGVKQLKFFLRILFLTLSFSYIPISLFSYNLVRNQLTVEYPALTPTVVTMALQSVYYDENRARQVLENMAETEKRTQEALASTIPQMSR